jgi:hypothetical protein
MKIYNRHTIDIQMKNDSKILIRLPKKSKLKFQKKCEKELIDMSVKIRQLILKELEYE